MLPFLPPTLGGALPPPCTPANSAAPQTMICLLPQGAYLQMSQPKAPGGQGHVPPVQAHSQHAEDGSGMTHFS